jgi:hypothetical protein
MNTSRWNLLGAGCGVIDVLLSLIALLIVPLPPAVGSSVKDVLSYYTTNGPTLVLSNYLLMLATVFFLGFFGYVCVVLRMAEGEPHTLSRIVFGAAVAAASVFLLSPLLSQALMARAATGGDGAVVGMLSDLTALSLIASGIPAILLVGLASVVMLRTRQLPRWLGLLGLLLVVLLLLASAGLLLPVGPLAAGGIFTTLVFACYLLWELTLSIVLVARVLTTKRTETVPGIA